MNVIGIDGDGGDCLASLILAKKMGGAQYIFHQGRNPRPFQTIAHMLIPLFDAQSYVHGCMWSTSSNGVTHDLCHWRPKFYRPDQTLAQSMANSLNMGELDYSPWIEGVTPHPGMSGRVVVARSPRYQSPSFPWRQVAQHYKDALIFIGLPEEHQHLQRVSGRSIEHKRIKDFMHMAEVVAGAKLLVANQTGIGWISHGLGTPLVQEVEMRRRIWDTQINRPNAIYYKQGPLNLP